MLRIIGRCQLSFNECLLKNLNSFLESAKQFKHGQPPPVLEPDDEFELGNFTKDLKPYLANKRRKSYADKYLEEQQQHDKNEVPVIICKNKKLNHYRNQTYDKFKPIPLASEHWKSHKFRGDYFTIRIHSRDYELKSRKEPVPFEGSNLRAEFVDILKSRGIEFMSEIQELALPAILSGRNNSFGAETGSGKTLAYLLPIFEQILQWKENVIKPSFNAPYVLILVPSRELADQIRDFCRWFSHLGIKTQRIVGGSIKKKINNPIFDEIDILVSTPGVIEKLTHAEIYSMQNVRHVVLDEADCLLDDSFSDIVLHFLRRIHFRNEPSPDVEEDGVQLTMISATMPTSVREILENIIDVEKLDVICTDRVHHILPNITHKFVKTGRTSKPSYFLDIAKQNYKKKAPSIIFCNRIETCNWVSSFLEDNNIPNILLHGEISLRDRKGKFQHFQEGAVNTLVSTSFAARGLDTSRVEHVVNFEFPSFIVEYIHRCGRVGRLSSKKHGVVTNLIAGRNEVPLVQKIERAVRLNTELENVNPNIRRILTYKNASDVEKEFGLLS